MLGLHPGLRSYVLVAKLQHLLQYWQPWLTRCALATKLQHLLQYGSFVVVSHAWRELLHFKTGSAAAGECAALNAHSKLKQESKHRNQSYIDACSMGTSVPEAKSPRPPGGLNTNCDANVANVIDGPLLRKGADILVSYCLQRFWRSYQDAYESQPAWGQPVS